MSYQRRTFRGNSGANDRRLPKHNARRRKKTPQQQQQQEQSDNDDLVDSNNNIDNKEFHSSSESESESESDSPIIIACTEENINNDNNNNNNNNFSQDDHHEEIVGDSFEKNDEKNDDEYQSNCSNDDDDNTTSTDDPPYLDEIKNLKRRIKNIQEISIGTSDAIVANTTTYQDNVLNATINCVNQWRSIVRYHKDDSRLSTELRKEVGIAVFQLIQLSIQSGPLSGGKPGYFKRCGSKIAKMCMDFLNEVVPQYEELGNLMGFSSNQMDTMKKWITNAEKAVQNDKPPTKSVTKKMQQIQNQNQQQPKGQKKKQKNKK
jgi:hypothetical protein